MTDYARQFTEHHPENYQRKYRCPWCEKDFIGESVEDCPCRNTCLCGNPASIYVECFGQWLCDDCRNTVGREINSYGGGE